MKKREVREVFNHGLSDRRLPSSKLKPRHLKCQAKLTKEERSALRRSLDSTMFERFNGPAYRNKATLVSLVGTSAAMRRIGFEALVGHIHGLPDADGLAKAVGAQIQFLDRYGAIINTVRKQAAIRRCDALMARIVDPRPFGIAPEDDDPDLQYVFSGFADDLTSFLDAAAILSEHLAAVAVSRQRSAGAMPCHPEGHPEALIEAIKTASTSLVDTYRRGGIPEVE